MEFWERQQNINRIISGQMRVRAFGQIFYVKSPTRDQKWLADEIFMDQLEEAKWSGAYTEEQLQAFLSRRGLWTISDEQNLEKIHKDMEVLKITVFETRLRTNDCQRARKTLNLIKKEYERLLISKHLYDHLSCLGIAGEAKNRYLLSCSIYDEGGQPYWTGEVCWTQPDPLVDKIKLELNNYLLSEAEFRELARTEPWKTTWDIQKYCKEPVFAGSSFDLTDEQKNLIIWSSIYEAVKNHPDNLQESIIEDDDMLDGWMILQRKEREKNHVKDMSGLTKNEKIKKAPEQFIMAQTMKDATEIMGANDMQGDQLFKQKMSVIKNKGVVDERQLPETKLRLQQQSMEMFNERKRI